MPRTPVPLVLPSHEHDWQNFVQTYVDDAREQSQRELDGIRDGVVADVREAWNDADVAMSQATALTSVLAEVHPDPEVRSLSERLLTECVTEIADRDRDPDLYSAFVALVPEHTGDPHADRMRELTVLDFRLAGAHLSDDARTRLGELTEAIAAAEVEFSANIRDAVGSIRVPPAALDGLPEDYLDSHPVGADGLVEITTDYPDLSPFLDMAHDGAAREALVRADYARAHPANDVVLSRLLSLRDEAARLVGFEGWPDYATARMMMTDGQGIENFLATIDADARPAGMSDVAMLLARKRVDDAHATAITISDSRYYIERIRQERYGVDPHEVRRYLDFGRVRDGILALAGQLFSVDFTEVENAPRWHPDVDVYDVLDDGVLIGRIHLDMHPRDGKYGHMACFGVVEGIAGKHLPESALVCNFSRGKLTFDELETFLHEFGHLMHAILSGHGRFSRLSGLSTRGEWDVVEAPSQLLEEWAWNHQVLSRFALDDDGRPMPAHLVDALRAGRHLCEGLSTCRQLAYATMSYRLHRDVPDDLAPFCAEIERDMDVREPLIGTHQYASFGHLTTYSACYYTYQWSLAIAKDLFTAFDSDDLLEPTVARRYRDTVLAPGSSKPAARLIEDFLGRPFSTAAYAEWLASLKTA